LLIGAAYYFRKFITRLIGKGDKAKREDGGALIDESVSGPPQEFNPSFRDPAGTLILRPSRILRIISKVAIHDLLMFLASKQGNELLSSGKLVRT
jgi:hypothetical protein